MHAVFRKPWKVLSAKLIGITHKTSVTPAKAGVQGL